ncbi:hypothetical protein [Nitratifractor sp.]
MLVILYAVVGNFLKGKKHAGTSSLSPAYREHVKKHSVEHWREELARVETPEYLHDYIVRVIEHGSRQLGFPGGEMEGGYVSAELAPRIACYVMELGGHKCSHPYPKDAAMYFSSVCAGRHGNDGKGIHGAYPDLTRPKLLGIERREIFLRGKIAETKRDK